jgi:hypothetical protein
MSWSPSVSGRWRLHAFALATTAFLALELPGAGQIPSPDRPVELASAPLRPDTAIKLRQEFLKRMAVDAWHRAGITGRGIKIAILDSGFRDYRSCLGKGLPPAVQVRSFRADGDLEARESQHGILCGEVIHALAPDAALLFANWDPDQPTSFLRAAQWAKDQGAKVLSCSLIMPSWSDGEGGGTFNAQLASMLGTGRRPDDLLFFACAGNTAQRHWSGPPDLDKAGYHQWTSGRRNNPMTPWGMDRVSVELYGKACEGLELRVVDAALGTEVAVARATAQGSASGSPCAVVRFLPQAGSHYQVQLRASNSILRAAPGSMHLVVLGGTLHYSTPGGSIACPADCPSSQAVGAVDQAGRPLNYSSRGPNSPLPKPDFVAEVPFPSLIRDRSFAGTSAAAPQAAALAALVWSRHPNWPGQQVRQALQSAARDLGPVGHDWETGHGLIRLPALAD